MTREEISNYLIIRATLLSHWLNYGVLDGLYYFLKNSSHTCLKRCNIYEGSHRAIILPVQDSSLTE